MKSNFVVDARLVVDCANALREMPARRFVGGANTYDLSLELDKVIESQNLNDIEVLQELVDAQSIAINRDVPMPCAWQHNELLSNYVAKVHRMIKVIGMVDRFNYHMDMLGRDDLVIPVAEPSDLLF